MDNKIYLKSRTNKRRSLVRQEQHPLLIHRLSVAGKNKTKMPRRGQRNQRRSSNHRRRTDSNGFDENEIEEILKAIFQQQQGHNGTQSNPCNAVKNYLQSILAALFPSRGDRDQYFQQSNASSSSSSPPSSNSNSNSGSSSSSSNDQHNINTSEENIDPFQVLELDRATADAPAVVKAWKLLARKYHPDKNRDNIEASEIKMKEINAAKNACLGILDGSTDESGAPKRGHSWEEPSDDDDEDESSANDA